MRTIVLLATVSATGATSLLPAQARLVDLTGQPQATLSESFTRIARAQEIAPGRVVLSDIAERRLMLGDIRADAVRPIGRQGSGPGEWQVPGNVLHGPEGMAYVPDPGLRKVHVVNAEGKLTRSVPFPGLGDAGSPVRAGSLPQGVDAMGRLFFTGSPFNPQTREQPESIAVLRWDATGTQTDTMAMLPNEARIQQSSASGNLRVTTRFGRGPLRANTSWAALPNGGVAIIQPSPYRVDIVAPNGVLTTGTPVPFTPIRVTAAERDAERQRRRAQIGTAVTIGGPGGSRSAPLSALGEQSTIPDAEFPATMGPFVGSGSVQVTPEGEIWILRARPTMDPTPTYDIFSATGTRQGQARLRPHSRVVGFGTGVVYVVRQDPEDDLEFVEEYARR